MKIKLNRSIYDGIYLKDEYSKYATKENLIDGIPYNNFPFEIENISEEYRYISWALIDHDSNPVVNFSWIHWLIANYEVKKNAITIPGKLVNSNNKYLGGTNSFAGPLTNIINEKIILNYGGPTPPDKDHTYTLYVYAHTNELLLEKGFYYNEFLKELDKQKYVMDKVKILAKK